MFATIFGLHFHEVDFFLRVIRRSISVGRVLTAASFNARPAWREWEYAAIGYAVAVWRKK
jgi:hypothetical protein